MVPKLESSAVSVLLVAITLIFSWWIADKAHSHLPKPKTNNGSSGIEGKISGLAIFDILISMQYSIHLNSF